jgi:cobyrinic acid a,c-diamide synthase
MSRLRRVAVGTIQPEAESQSVLWGLMEALRRIGLQVQSFLSQACFPKHQGATTITGMPPRHLDSWLMSPELCQAIFVRGAQDADLAVVEGRFDATAGDEDRGGRLEPLCRWLNLPRLVVLDASEVERSGLPDRPKEVDGLLLDRVLDGHHLAGLTTDLEALWGVPVLGALEPLTGLRARLKAVPRGDAPPPLLCRELGDHFARNWQPQRLMKIASRRPFPNGSCGQLPSEPNGQPLTVAIAYDEGFNCYFQDALDLLELGGASVVDFSPLRDESLPPQTDVVYLGCGHPERHAATLAANHCMKAALRSHLAAGRRIYGEGGGAAYLCQQMETPDGQWMRMVGILPAAAHLRRASSGPTPVEVTLRRPNWLGQREMQLRGYRNPNWDARPVGAPAGFVAEEKHRDELLGNFLAVGSLVHLDFAAQPTFLDRFFQPEDAESDFRDPWAAEP